MTKQKDLKRRIRERMRRTGESYTTARLHILRSRPVPAAPAAPPPLVAASAPLVTEHARPTPAGPPARLRLPRTRGGAVEPSGLTYAVPVFAILLFTVVALTGCADGASEAGVAVSDSAGIRIVENPAGSIEAAEAWTLSDHPVVEIGGGADAATPLLHVTDVAPLGDGRVAVGTNTPPQVHVFDEDGTLTAGLGRPGRGPGEFMSVASVVPLAGDSVAVWDADRRRLSIFESDGRFMREVDLGDVAPLSARAAPSMDIPSGFTHVLAAGPEAFVISAEAVSGSDATSGIARARLPAVRISTMGDVLAVSDPIPGMEMVHGGPAGTLPLPFGARTSAATSGETLIVGTGEHPEFRIHDARGRLTGIVRWPDVARATDGDWLDEWTSMVDSAPPPVRELVAGMPRRDGFPAFDQLLTSDAGAVLVGEYAGPVGIFPLRRADEGPEALQPVRRTRARRWLVFDPDGVLTARFRTPEGFAPAAVRGERVWGVFTDALGIESVRAYRIAR